MITLWPPLEVLEKDLFSPSNALVTHWASGGDVSPEMRTALENDADACALRDALNAEPDTVPPPATGSDESLPPMPPDLRALIRQRVASRQATFSRLPTPGQIVRIDEVRGPQGLLDWDLPQPVMVLLSEPTEIRTVWYGWLVTAESDYAGYWDVLLEPADRPLDPQAAMVQLWNPVHVFLPAISRVIGELKPERIAAVRALAVECATAPEPDRSLAKPGQTIRRSVAEWAIRTGTPLGDSDDPRYAYQQLYHTYAEAVREPARLAAAQAASAAPSWWENVVATLGRFFEPCQPMAHAMGEADAAEQHEGRHYQIPGLSLVLTVAADDLALLRLEQRDAQTWRIQVLDQDEIVQTACLDERQPVEELRLDPAKPHILHIRNADQSQAYRVPLFAADTDHDR